MTPPKTRLLRSVGKGAVERRSTCHASHREHLQLRPLAGYIRVRLIPDGMSPPCRVLRSQTARMRRLDLAVSLFLLLGLLRVPIRLELDTRS